MLRKPNMQNSKVDLLPQSEDLSKCIRILLIFGRIIGVIPYSGVTTGRTEDLKFRWKSFGAIISCIISVFMALNLFAGTIGFFKCTDRSAQGIAINSIYAILSSASLCNYLFFLLKADEFIRIMRDWRRMTFHFGIEDGSLRRDIILIVVINYTSIILENAAFHVKHGIAIRNQMASSDGSNSTYTALELFYYRTAPRVASVLPYHPVIMGSIFVTNKFGLYSREFGDVFIIVVSRALYYKFKLLVQKANEELFCGGKEDDPQKMKHLMQDFKTILTILTSFEVFLSPLIFLSYSISIYYISLRLSVTLEIQENLTLVDSLYVNWSFLHGIVRTYFVSLSAAKINEHALTIRSLLAKCPQELYSPEVKRFEYELNNSTIGLKGFGSFTVTKQFMLKLIGVIFTVEIVLLQSHTK